MRVASIVKVKVKVKVKVRPEGYCLYKRDGGFMELAAEVFG